MSDPVCEEYRHNSNVDLQYDIDVTNIGKSPDRRPNNAWCRGRSIFYYYVRMINANSKNIIHHTLDGGVMN